MSTASLSGLLTRVGSLTESDVRELEKLAESYPYCQTAHLLLAKALYDRGSVLAGQKLRRAATGAPDRRLLRQLLAHTPTAPSTAPPVSETPGLAISTTGELVTPAPEAEVPMEEVTAAVEPAAATEVEPTAAEVVTLETEPAPTAAVVVTLETEPAPTAADVITAEPEVEPTAADVVTAEPEPAPTAAVVVTEEPEVEPTAAVVVTAEPEVEPTAEGEAAAVPAPEAVAETAVAPPVVATAVAPPPAGPVLVDFDLVPDTSPAAVERLLFDTDDEAPAGLALLTAEPPAPAPVSVPLPDLAPDPALAYWVSSSRLGVELTAADFAPTAADGVPDTVPAPDLTAPWLPTAPPDARWPEHIAAHQPAPPAPAPRRPFDHQFALIERFLREKPRLRAIDPTRPLPEKLPDLAQQSTRRDEGVVSESMARILARQGKTARAVAMYENLQARLPEKAAIFAARIAALRNPPAD